MSSYKKRYQDTRWQIVYGSFKGPERVAVIELQRTIQAYFSYVVEVVPAAGGTWAKDAHLIVVGTQENNPLIKELIRSDKIAKPNHPQGYILAGLKSPYKVDCHAVAIAGHDAIGVLYGVYDFLAGVVAPNLQPDYPHQLRASFDNMPEFREAGRPLISRRGIWTWGYVVYDYRRYLDVMAKLKMNMLTLWNDTVPLNIDSIIDYAHERGIQIIMGFHWGWGHDEIDLSKTEDRDKVKKSVLENYMRNYKNLPIDGIYFQTLTEHKNLEIGGKSVASLACELVNDTARAVYEVTPNLHIQFGLHASSIANRFVDLERLDKRVVIVWEDAGMLPFSYAPSVETRHSAVTGVDTMEKTIEYSKKLATFRPGTPFGMVPKGWSHLDWGTEFEHHGEFILGERDPKWIASRRAERQRRWDRVDSKWMKLFPHSVKFYAEVLDVNPDLIVTGLVEDGMIEEGIPSSVALFAETIWDPKRNPQDIFQRAISPYYR